MTTTPNQSQVNELLNKRPTAKNGHSTRDEAKKASSAKAGSSIANGLDGLSDRLSDGILDNIAAQVEVKVSKGIVDGSLMDRIEDRLLTRFEGISQGIEQETQLLEMQLEEIDSDPLYLPSVSLSSTHPPMEN